MSYPIPSPEEKACLVGELLQSFKEFGYTIDIVSFAIRASELWPCSHRLRSLDGFRCKKPWITTRLRSDPSFFDETRTDFYWNADEVIVGKPAIAAGLAETAADQVENASALLRMYLILEKWFAECKIPFLTGEYHGTSWIPDVEYEAPAVAMLRRFDKRIENVLEDDVWDAETRDIEHKRLTTILDGFNSLWHSNRNDYSLFSRYALFSDAAADAKLIASEFSNEVSVRRAETGWAIYVAGSPNEHNLENVDCTGEDVYDPGEDEYEHVYDYERADERNLILEEAMEDQESWWLSDEDGWFYSDE